MKGKNHPSWPSGFFCEILLCELRYVSAAIGIRDIHPAKFFEQPPRCGSGSSGVFWGCEGCGSRRGCWYGCGCGCRCADGGIGEREWQWRFYSLDYRTNTYVLNKSLGLLCKNFPRPSPSPETRLLTVMIDILWYDWLLFLHALVRNSDKIEENSLLFMRISLYSIVCSILQDWLDIFSFSNDLKKS